jgi:hypothetical protein
MDGRVWPVPVHVNGGRLLQIQLISFIILYVRTSQVVMFVQSWLDTHTVLHRCQCVQSYSQWLIIFTPAEKCISSHTYILVIMALWLRSTIHSMQRDRESAHKILRMKRRRSGDGMKRDPFPPGLDALLNDLVALSSLTRLERESVCVGIGWVGQAYICYRRRMQCSL